MLSLDISLQLGTLVSYLKLEKLEL